MEAQCSSFACRWRAAHTDPCLPCPSHALCPALTPRTRTHAQAPAPRRRRCRWAARRARASPSPWGDLTPAPSSRLKTSLSSAARCCPAASSATAKGRPPQQPPHVSVPWHSCSHEWAFMQPCMNAHKPAGGGRSWRSAGDAHRLQACFLPFPLSVSIHCCFPPCDCFSLTTGLSCIVPSPALLRFFVRKETRGGHGAPCGGGGWKAAAGSGGPLMCMSAPPAPSAASACIRCHHAARPSAAGGPPGRRGRRRCGAGAPQPLGCWHCPGLQQQRLEGEQGPPGGAAGAHACGSGLERCCRHTPRPSKAGRRLPGGGQGVCRGLLPRPLPTPATDERQLPPCTTLPLPFPPLAPQNATAASDGTAVRPDSCGFSAARGDDWPGVDTAALNMGSPPINAFAMKGCGACFELQCGAGPDNSSFAEAQVPTCMRWCRSRADSPALPANAFSHRS